MVGNEHILLKKCREGQIILLKIDFIQVLKALLKKVKYIFYIFFL